MGSNIINICISCDDNYAQYASVVMASVLTNASKDDNISFYILDGGINNDKKEKILTLKKTIKDCEINFVDINEEDFNDYKSVNTHKYITLPTFYRLKLPELLPNVNRVIYLDCDVVVNTSLAELFNISMGESSIAGVHDIDKKDVRRNPTCVNAGVLVMDLDNMRKYNIQNKFLEWTKEHIDEIVKGDQQIINETLKGNIVIVQDKWNVQSSNFSNRSSFITQPNIVHFVARKKPWHYASFSYHRDLYFKYLQLTPWKLTEQEYKHWTKDNQRDSIIEYIKYRPLFWLRPSFYKAIYLTYIKKLRNNL